ncbi:MAG TPA: diacylglycerol kinase family protein [Patescibacteria group bacterium]|nr:diacylglycerol kinase family protein [Patescibacteria group bacterium]
MKRLIKSFLYAFKGLSKTWREEKNLQVQSLAALLILVLAFYLRISSGEWLAVIFAIALVLTMEMINSAVERITDVLKPRINGYVKEIKDIMAGAVMLASVTALIIGLIVFLPYFI